MSPRSVAIGVVLLAASATTGIVAFTAGRSGRRVVTTVGAQSESSDPGVAEDVAAVKNAFELAEDVCHSLTTPPPDQGSAKDFVGLSTTSPLAKELGIPPLADDVSAKPIAHLDASGRHGYMTPDELARWDLIAVDALNKMFAPSLASGCIDTIRNAARAQTSDTGSYGMNGSHRQTNLTLAGAGGARVKQFEAVTVNGDAATLSAIVTHWLTLGFIDPKSGAVTWQHPEGNWHFEATLQRGEDGHWRVAKEKVDEPSG